MVLLLALVVATTIVALLYYRIKEFKKDQKAFLASVLSASHALEQAKTGFSEANLDAVRNIELLSQKIAEARSLSKVD